MTELRNTLNTLFTQTSRQLFLATLGSFLSALLGAMAAQVAGLTLGLLVACIVILLTVIYILRLRREDEIDQRLSLLERDLTEVDSVAAIRRERDLLLEEHNANLDVLESQVKGRKE